jgi:hypothetical protein
MFQSRAVTESDESDNSQNEFVFQKVTAHKFKSRLVLKFRRQIGFEIQKADWFRLSESNIFFVWDQKREPETFS